MLPFGVPRITRDEVERIADLARLSLTDGEADEMTAQMGAILDYVALLEEVDVSAVEPTAHATPIRMELRSDEPQASLPSEEALRNAPRRDAATFLVPRVVEGEEG